LQETPESVDIVTIARVHVDLEYLRVVLFAFNRTEAGTTTPKGLSQQ
jgi:hypothetical protein